MLVKIEARILIFPGTDFHFPSTSVPPGTFLGYGKEDGGSGRKRQGRERGEGRLVYLSRASEFPVTPLAPRLIVPTPQATLRSVQPLPHSSPASLTRLVTLLNLQALYK